MAILAVYLLTRLVNLGLLPMVSDEGTYITWGIRALHARAVDDWLASLEDGKQPLLAWLMPPLLAFVPDRLIAGRLVSVLSGLVNVALLVIIGRRLFGPATGWVAGALYVVAPIALIHDRLALYDSLVTTSALLVLWVTLAWAKRPSAGRTMALGLTMGLALLTKLSALFFLALAPLVVLLWRPAARRRWWLLAQSYFIAAAVYSVLYVSPIVGNIEQGTFRRYSLTLGEVLRLPLNLWWKNVVFIAEAGVIYLGWPLALLAVAGLAAGVMPGARGRRVMALWTLAPLLCFALTAKIIYSRYFVFCLVAALLPAAEVLVGLARFFVPGGALSPWSEAGTTPAPWERNSTSLDRRSLGRARNMGRAAPWLLAAAATAIAVPSLSFGARLLFDPPAAPWMNDQRYITDRFQYVESNFAGYGLPQIVGFLRAQAQTRPIAVLARDTTGMPRDGVTAYLLDWPNVAVAFVPETESIQASLTRRPDWAYQLASQGADVYYVLSDAPNGEQERRFRQLNPDLQLVMEVPKPGRHSRFQLYWTRWPRQTDDHFLDPPALLGGQIYLRGFRLSTTTVQPGETVPLTLYWQAQRRPDRNYTVFNHLTGDGGTIWGQKDGQPLGDAHRTSRWRLGEGVADTHELAIKPDAPPGTYELKTGMYSFETLARLPAERDGLTSDGVVLARITVVNP